MMQMEFYNRSWERATDLSSAGADAGAGTFFVIKEFVRAGDYSGLFQLQFVRGGVDCNVRLAAIGPEKETLAEVRLAVAVASRDDRVLMQFSLKSDGVVEFRGWVSANQAGTLLRMLTIVPGNVSSIDDAVFNFGHIARPEPRLDVVIVGTTTICPASCKLCPTNKVARAHVPKGTMSMEVFGKLVEELASINYEGPIIFGLFGEPLSDPLLADRLKLCKAEIPMSHLGIATTAAVYDPVRHAGVVSLADSFTIHLESFERARYNEMMAPLRLERVLPNISKLVEVARSKTRLTMPLNKHNVHEIQTLNRISDDLGLDHPLVSPISNRCGEAADYEDKTIFPMATACHPAKVESELVVDWDGTILTCCFDFLRHGASGNIVDMPLADYLRCRPSSEIVRKLERKRWHNLEMCRDCRFDDCGRVEKLPLVFRYAGAPTVLEPARFSRGQSKQVTSKFSAAWIRRQLHHEIWGPYEKLGVGRYYVKPLLRFRFGSARSRVRVEVLISEIPVWSMDVAEGVGHLPERIEFSVSETSEFQLRVSTFDAEVDFSGVVIGHQ